MGHGGESVSGGEVRAQRSPGIAREKATPQHEGPLQ